MKRALAMVSAMAAGALFPSLAGWYWIISWILFAMLFTTFSNMDCASLRPGWSHARLLGLWMAMAPAGYVLLRPFGPDAALAGFLVGSTPTATAAAAITRILGGEVGFVTVSFLGSNLLAAILLPVALPLLGPCQIPSTIPFLARTLPVVLGPLALGAMVRKVPGWGRVGPRLKGTSFPLWIGALVLASAKTSEFLRGHRQDPKTIAAIAIGSGILCAANFLLGRWAGGPDHRLEAGQSLGQKNTMFSLWLGLVSFGPVAALGPAFYVVWHNLWNAFQMAALDRVTTKTK